MSKCFTTNVLQRMLNENCLNCGADISQLDPNGVHVITHHICVGQVVQGGVMFKLPDTDIPLMAKFNMDVKEFNMLSDVEEVLAELKEVGDADWHEISNETF